MPEAVLVRGGPRLYLVLNGRVTDEGIPLVADQLVQEGSLRLSASMTNLARSSPGLLAADGVLKSALERAGIPAALAPSEALRAARGHLPVPDPVEERRFLRTLAHLTIERILARPEEVLISLAREEERVERALRRDENAAHQFLEVGNPALGDYVQEWTQFRNMFREHHRMLEEKLEASARLVVPNLTALVGARVAARLVAQAGGVTPLATMSASRLQLLGSRRRPAGGHGPRFGILYRATRMTEVPLGRQGAFARSLAASAVMAVRADWSTHRSISDFLVRRRDRRIHQLQRGQL